MGLRGADAGGVVALLPGAHRPDSASRSKIGGKRDARATDIEAPLPCRPVAPIPGFTSGALLFVDEARD